MRLAFVDLVFSWPPNGGADIDAFQVITGLQDAGYTVQSFFAHEAGSMERGRLNPETLPFPVARLEFTRRTLQPAALTAAFQAALTAWKPDLIFALHGFALKPFLLNALGERWPLVSRYYAHELTCLRDPKRFRNGAPCPNNFLTTPNRCRRCALAGQRQAIQTDAPATWTRDFLAAKAWRPAYHRIAQQGLKKSRVLVVYNEGIKAQLTPHHPDIRVIPGGIDPEALPYSPLENRPPQAKKKIYMGGRVEDPAKGLAVLLAAGEALASERNDFEIVISHPDPSISQGWLRALGWRSPEESLADYAAADICVVPSLWEEPFGLVALEAMAAGRPVCASRTGGLAETISHEETGFLFPPGDAPELAAALSRLLDDDALRISVGERGRQRALEHYPWKRIIERYYIPLIEDLAP